MGLGNSSHNSIAKEKVDKTIGTPKFNQPLSGDRAEAYTQIQGLVYTECSKHSPLTTELVGRELPDEK